MKITTTISVSIFGIILSIHYLEFMQILKLNLNYVTQSEQKTWEQHSMLVVIVAMDEIVCCLRVKLFSKIVYSTKKNRVFWFASFIHTTEWYKYFRLVKRMYSPSRDAALMTLMITKIDKIEN